MRRLGALALLLALAGCGSTHHAAPPQPRLPALLAHAWARRADAVAAKLDAGDGCAAQTAAVTLQTDVVTAINAKRIPGALLEPLGSKVNSLVARIACAPAQPSANARREATALAAWLRRNSP